MQYIVYIILNFYWYISFFFYLYFSIYYFINIFDDFMNIFIENYSMTGY